MIGRFRWRQSTCELSVYLARHVCCSNFDAHPRRQSPPAAKHLTMFIRKGLYFRPSKRRVSCNVSRNINNWAVPPDWGAGIYLGEVISWLEKVTPWLYSLPSCVAHKHSQWVVARPSASFFLWPHNIAWLFQCHCKLFRYSNSKSIFRVYFYFVGAESWNN